MTVRPDLLIPGRVVMARRPLHCGRCGGAIPAGAALVPGTTLDAPALHPACSPEATRC